MTQHWKIGHFVIFPHLAQKLVYSPPNFQSEIPTVLLLLLLFGWLVLSFFTFFACLFCFILCFWRNASCSLQCSFQSHWCSVLDVGCCGSLVLEDGSTRCRVGWLCCEVSPLLTVTAKNPWFICSTYLLKSLDVNLLRSWLVLFHSFWSKLKPASCQLPSSLVNTQAILSLELPL